MRTPHLSCIYCTQTKAQSEFNKEHVIPEAFGRFRGALTLARPRRVRVCRSCNQRFGDTLDGRLTRNSAEALMRLRFGTYNAAELGSYFQRGVRIRLEDEHVLGPLQVTFVQSAGDSEPQPIPMPQVRVRLTSRAVKCIPEAAIAKDFPPLIPSIAEKGVSLFWSASVDPGAEARLKAALTQCGYSPKEWKPDPDLPSLAPGEIQFQITAYIDQMLARALAKIVFNYFAYITNSALPLESRFNDVRNLVSTGSANWRQIVTPSNTAILANEASTGERALGHIVTVAWDPAPSSPIRGSVALFNDVRYDVILTTDSPLIWQDIASGHFYNFATRQVLPLTTSRLLLPRSRRSR